MADLLPRALALQAQRRGASDIEAVEVLAGLLELVERQADDLDTYRQLAAGAIGLRVRLRGHEVSEVPGSALIRCTPEEHLAEFQRGNVRLRKPIVAAVLVEDGHILRGQHPDTPAARVLAIQLVTGKLGPVPDGPFRATPPVAQSDTKVSPPVQLGQFGARP